MGGLVRVTGAGMGCPDWPKCFGKWVPPTDISQLPADYKEIYKKPGHVVADFNVVHTYTEYINRLSGAILGIVMMFTAVSSLQFIRKKRGWITVLSVLALLLTGFQGWIGAKVVDNNLAAWIVTIHMMIALVIVVIMMLPVWMPVIREHVPVALPHARTLRTAAMVFTLLTLFQVLLGTQVREKVDEAGIAAGIDWNQALGGVLIFHRTASLVITALITWLLFKTGREAGKQSAIYRTTGFLVILVISQLLTGVLNVYMSFSRCCAVTAHFHRYFNLWIWVLPVHAACTYQTYRHGA